MTKQEFEDLTSKVHFWISRLEKAKTKLVYCQNPWDLSCESQQIELYIDYEGRKNPICQSCWHKIAESNDEW